MKSLHALLFVISTVLFIGKIDIIRAASHSDTNEEDWIDPFDMINYDRTTKSMYEKPRNPVQENAANEKMKQFSIITAQLQQCEQKLNSCRTEVDALIKPTRTSKSVNVAGNAGDESRRAPKENCQVPVKHQICVQNELYMRRIVNILLKTTKLNEDMPLELDTTLRISVNMEQLKILQQFGKGDQDISLQQLENTLSSVLLAARSNIFYTENALWPVISDYLLRREVLLAFILGILPVIVLWNFLRGHSIVRITLIFAVISFLISFSVTYCRMYKEEEIKQYAVLKRNPNVPAECRPPEELTWLQTFQELLKSKLSFQSNKCQQYYEAVMMDPFLKVTPTVVISEMLSSFLLHPSGKLGESIASFVNNIMGNLPFGINYLVLLGTFILLIIIIFASCGGVVKLPFFLGGLELSGRRPLEGAPPRQQISEEGEVPKLQHSVSREESLSNLLKAVDSSDSGLVITTARGIQLLSTHVLHGREALQDIYFPPSESKPRGSIHSQEQNIEESSHVPGCCGESKTRCQHAVMDASSTTLVQHSVLQPKKNRTEELRLRKAVALSESEEEISKVLPLGSVQSEKDSINKTCSHCACSKNVLEMKTVDAETKNELAGVEILREIVETDDSGILAVGINPPPLTEDDDSEEISFVKL